MKKCLAISLLYVILLNVAHGQIKSFNGKEISGASLDQFLKKQMDTLQIPGLSIAVINDGKIVYHRVMGESNIETHTKVDEQTVFEAASMTKPIFAFFVLRMVEKGLIALDTPIYRYMPNTDLDYDDRYKLITPRMVLDHTTGLPNWRSSNRGLELDIKFTPGTQYSYSGEAFEYLANTIAHLLNVKLTKLEEVFNKEVGYPMGMKHSDFVWNDYLAAHKATGYWEVGGKRVARDMWKQIYFSSAAGLQTEATSYASFLMAIMNEKVLKKTTLDEMLRAQVQISDTTRSYNARCLGFAMEPSPYGTRYVHGGSNGNYTGYCMFYREKKMGYVYFTNCDKGYDLNLKLKVFMTEGKN